MRGAVPGDRAGVRGVRMAMLIYIHLAGFSDADGHWIRKKTWILSARGTAFWTGLGLVGLRWGGFLFLVG